MRLVATGLWILVLALLVAAVVPWVPSDAWLIRMADFPRLQFGLAAVVLAAVAAWLGRRRRGLRAVAAVALS